MSSHSSKPNRRQFLKTSALAAASGSGVLSSLSAAEDLSLVDDFAREDSLYHGSGWESLNPGYWQIKDGALRRRVSNLGDRARRTGFPFHSKTNNDKPMEVEYDPSLPPGFLWRRDHKLSGDYRICIQGRYLESGNEVQREGDNPQWAMYQRGHALMGLGFGGKSLLEGYDKASQARMAAWSDDGTFAIRNSKGKPIGQVAEAALLNPGDQFEIEVSRKGTEVEAILKANGQVAKATASMKEDQADGYFGCVARGLADFEISEVGVQTAASRLDAQHAECYACYPLGDTLSQNDRGQWEVRFVGIFASDGSVAEIRIADSADPDGGWAKVPVAGSAKIVNNDFRRNTASILATLPGDPSKSNFYYTVWKDGVDVTRDPRIGSAGSGPGTGMVGDVPAAGTYVGRLPQLRAPYRLAGLSCHAINSGVQSLAEKKMVGGGNEWQIRDQPTEGAYRYFEDYDLQILVWEDDVWYMELVIYPPSVDDAYKIVTTSICGPTSRWQLMRHWNVINPGDHDYGMDDVKGPEQIMIRNLKNLGQDPDYMRRNFQIVHHLVTGEEEVDGTVNPKKWRRWKMPNRDFSLIVLDSRLWRSSQDTQIWEDWGWGHIKDLYDRRDPTRSLLGEEQFAWLEGILNTDSSPLICLTGINSLHSVWTGIKTDPETQLRFAQDDRVSADYASWVAAGASRVLELLGSRTGITTVFGDIHVGSILENKEQRILESSFGPIGRSANRPLKNGKTRAGGGRDVIDHYQPGETTDADGRPIEMLALYHPSYKNPQLDSQDSFPHYWNFLCAEFDSRAVDPEIRLSLHNLIDPVTEPPRGGGAVGRRASETGRKPSSFLPGFKTLPLADVTIAKMDGSPVRALRSDADGAVLVTGLPDLEAGTKLLVTATDGERAAAQLLETIPV